MKDHIIYEQKLSSQLYRGLNVDREILQIEEVGAFACADVLDPIIKLLCNLIQNYVKVYF